MDFRVGRVLKLLQAEGIWSLVHQLLAFADGSCHALDKSRYFRDAFCKQACSTGLPQPAPVAAATDRLCRL